MCVCESEFSCLCRTLKVMGGKKAKSPHHLFILLSLSLKQSVLAAAGTGATATRDMSASVRTVSMAHIVKKVK